MFLGRHLSISLLAVSLGLTLSLAHASTEFEIPIPSDASRSLMNALAYQNEVPYGTGHRCKVQIVRPDAGEKPLQNDKNMIFCSFTGRTGDPSHFSLRLDKAEVHPSEGKTIAVSGYIPTFIISAIYETFQKLGDPLPRGTLWESSTTCDAKGIECSQLFSLKSKFQNAGIVPVMVCYRHSILTTVPSKVKLDRSKFSSETAYLNELIWQQGVAMDRGMDSNSCGFLYEESHALKPEVTVHPKKSDPRVSVTTADLRAFSFVSRDAESPIFKYALNSFQSEARLTPALNQTLSDDAQKAADEIRASGGHSTARLSQHLNRSLHRLRPLFKTFSKYDSSVQSFMVMLSLIPDPDRWFLLSGAIWLDWKVLPQTEFLTKIPVRLRPLGAQAVSYRVGRTLYVNQGFLDSDYYRVRERDGFENWLMWETLKLWIPADGDYDFVQFGERFSRAMSSGTLNEFRARDKHGQPGLNFVPFVEEMTRKVRATTQWAWLAENTQYFGRDLEAGFDLDFFAPVQVRGGDGKSKESYSFQYLSSKPGEVDYDQPVFNKPDLRLFCESASQASATSAELTPAFGRFSIQGLTVTWKGIEPLTSHKKDIPFSTKAECQTRLPKEVIQLIEDVSRSWK